MDFAFIYLLVAGITLALQVAFYIAAAISTFVVLFVVREAYNFFTSTR